MSDECFVWFLYRKSLFILYLIYTYLVTQCGKMEDVLL